MGSLDRTDGRPDPPNELASAADQKPPKSGEWLNPDREPDGNLIAFLGENRQDRRLPDMTGKPESLAEAGVRGGALPRWKPTDPIELPDIVVRKDIGPGIKPPDYRNPDAKDTLKLEHGQEVIVGKQDSADNPRRIAEVRHDRIIDKQTDEPPPEDPSGEEFLDDVGQTDRSRGRDLLKGTVERFDDTADAIQKAGDQLEMALKNPEPTGTGTRLPPGTTIFDTPPSAATTGSLAVGIVELAVLGMAAVRTGMKHYRATIEKRSDDASNG